jgi:hypothetical protein
MNVKLAGALVLMGLIHSQDGLALTFQVDPGTSSILASRSPYDPSLPVDEVGAALTGTFDFSIEPAPEYFVDKKYVYVTTLTNIDVQSVGGVALQSFSSFKGLVTTDGKASSATNCVFFYLSGIGGSCYSTGPVYMYSGTFDGTRLVIDGQSFYSPIENKYHIEAVMAPEPSTACLIPLGLGAAAVAARRRKK